MDCATNRWSNNVELGRSKAVDVGDDGVDDVDAGECPLAASR